MAKEGVDNPTPPSSQLWQLPLLVVSTALLGAGIVLVAWPDTEAVDVDAALDTAQATIAAGQYEPAIDRLNQLAANESDRFTTAHQQRLHLLRADAQYLHNRTEGWRVPQNFEKIIAEYRTAESLGAKLDGQRLLNQADCLIALGQLATAQEFLPAFSDQQLAFKIKLYKRLITASLAPATYDSERAQGLLEQMIRVQPLTTDIATWAAARQAELLLIEGKADEAVNVLVQRAVRHKAADEPIPGELLVLLGRAYLATGDDVQAAAAFEDAAAALDSIDPLNGEVLTGLGQARLNEHNVTDAIEHFDRAVKEYPGSAAFIDALVGRAESLSRLGRFDLALDDYTHACEIVAEPGLIRHGAEERLGDSIITQFDQRFDQSDYDRALKLLKLVVDVAGEPTPPPILRRLASTHQRQAEAMLGVEPDSDVSDVDWQAIDQVTRALVRQHLAEAAGHYLDHARAVVIQSDDAFGESLWRAADNFDRAGEHAAAIEAFIEYMEGRPSDPRHLAARHRLAQAYQADGQIDEAVKLYKGLIDENPNSPEAYGSLIPLARCYLAKGEKTIDLAEHVLLTIVEDHPSLRPESAEFREALVELGRLYYGRGRTGDMELAIHRLQRAIEQYPDDPLRSESLFMAADAYQRSAAQLEQRLSEPLAASQKADAAAERKLRLDAAIDLFTQAIDTYESRDPATLSDEQKLYLRNSYFYRADCAYALRRFEGPGGAIEYYDLARQQYEQEPAVLVALIQMVNCYCELGQFDRARTVNEKAKWYLRRITDEAFDESKLPMHRVHWQRWLDWTTQLAVRESDAVSGVSNVPTP